jgi:hypothetical protein
MYRWGTQLSLRSTSDWLPGVLCPSHLPWHDWSEPNVGFDGRPLEPWPGYELSIPSDWPSGVYVAVLVEADEALGDGPSTVAPSPDGRSARALFTVLPSAETAAAPILYKLPLFTYHAYNQVTARPYDPATGVGGWCLYSIPEPDQVPVPVPPSVGLRRPGGGTGGFPFDTFNVDPFDPTPRQTFLHWDAPFICWLEGNGHAVDYCTDLDVHDEDGARLLDGHRLLLSAGHDEYWSAAMRDHVESFVAAGGNVAFFGGNTCWGQIRFDDEVTIRRTGDWRGGWRAQPEPDRPENALTGVSFRNGGERDGFEHPLPVGYRVQHADHWVYEGTGLRDGDVFGDGPDEYLVGYECDGAHFDRAALAVGRPVEPSGNDGTPPDFVILGVGDLEPSGWGTGNRAATMGIHGTSGTVFTASTTDWPRLLRAGHPAVERITRNVVDRLSATDASRSGP